MSTKQKISTFRKSFLSIMLLLIAILISSCKNTDSKPASPSAQPTNYVKYATGLKMTKYDGYTVVRVSNPWPKAEKGYTYILKKSDAKLPDSLKRYTSINVPIQRIIVTSTTHIPSLELLDQAATLVAFPHLDYISSEKVRNLIDAGNVKELGNNESLNTEVAIAAKPDLIVGYGIDNNNPSLENLERSGIPVIMNGDWNEQNALGKAEWIKLFGALYDQEDKAAEIFKKIEAEYLRVLNLVENIKDRPTVMAGAIYNDSWILPAGQSWGAMLIDQGRGDYLWKDSPGTGSLSLSFEKVYEKASKAKYWIGPGQFTSLKEMEDSNPHYKQFLAFKTFNVYSFNSKKGKTGGTIYYEEAAMRPDFVIKDIVKILHPDLLPGYELYFFERLQ